MLKPLRMLLLSLAATGSLLCAGCASAAPATTKSTPSAPTPPIVAQHTDTDMADADKSWSNTAQEVLLSALSLSGVKYKYGGNSPETGFDCSGFVRYVFQQAVNLTLPHGARAISQLGETVAVGDLKPGDLVFFNTLKTAFSHVGIYLGNNRFIHAPSSGGGIQVVDMKDSYWAKRYNGARRIDDGNAEAVKATLKPN